MIATSRLFIDHYNRELEHWLSCISLDEVTTRGITTAA
jgi:hypothetical protein